MRTLKEYLKSINFTSKPKQSIIEIIKTHYDNISDKDSEEQVKGQIRDMVKAFPEYETRLNENGVDLLVKNDGKIVSIFECKSVRNKGEMVNEKDLNKKALHELITYFVEAYSEDKKNVPLFLVATNGKKWFVFNNSPFIDFVNNADAMRTCGLDKGILFPSKKKEEIYEHIKRYLGNNTETLENFNNNCFYFSTVEDIYHFLSPDIMLGKYNPNVGNVLNNVFYDELLYIFGLKEIKKDNKKTIIPNEVPNTFYSQIFNKTNDFEKSIELIIIWLNRILFLKLFEARLILFNDNYSFSFLNKNKIPDTATLETLFFDVLAVSEQNREPFAKSFDYIPYLNSSLFEEKEIEKDFPISKIKGNAPIEYFDKTILKDKESNKRKTGEVPLLDYLFEFLNAYNFGEEGDPSSLISPAVLGLVFEKINGYKDGSYYTPTEITDFMAKTAIEKAILNKVNEQLGLSYSDFEEFKIAFFDFSEDRRERVREIIRKLTILDPAVGSGHFLVSSLNVLLQIWYDFGMIKVNKEEYKVKFENGDIKLYKHEKPFVYRKNSSADDADFQQKIFKAKKEIIENNLFGVDINQNAVEIARLRLWIELLKNAYYKPDGTMETLPNIDINIKVGDSLLAPVIDVNVGLFVEKRTIDEYKNLFKQYQETSNKQERDKIKKELKQRREEIAEKGRALDEKYVYNNKLVWNIDFPHTIDENGQFKGFDVVIGNPPYIPLQENHGKHANLYAPLKFEVFERTGDIYELFIEKAYNLLTNKGLLSFITSNKWMRAGYGKDLRKFLRDKTTINVIIDFCGYKVFPEATVDTNILIVSKEKPAQTEQGTIGDKVTFEFLNVNEDEFVDSYNENIAEYFSEKKGIMKQNELSYDAFVLSKDKVFALKKKIESVGKPLKDWDVKIYRGIVTGFNDAFIIDTDKRNEILANCKTDDERKRTEGIIKPILRGRDIGKYYYKWKDLWLIYIPWHFPLHKNDNIQGASKEAEEEFKTEYPSVYSHLWQFKDDLLDRNKDETGIRYEWYALQRWASDYYSEFEKEKIVWQEIVREPTFAFDDSGMYCEATTFLMTGSNLKYIIGLLNSNPVTFFFRKYYSGGGLGSEGFRYKKAFLERLPIPPITPQNQPLVSQIESLVNQILGIKQSNPDADVSSLESQIDQLVYQLYDLTDEEVTIIKNEINKIENSKKVNSNKNDKKKKRNKKGEQEDHEA